ncbi:MAG TPA: tRNA (adenosine(37)-N6)-threonylcarbamoyltransferase complex dimerization subunit type 1 TsaB [Steroidobacteraceae bacterium]|nr:tRNA (adenosine(37)-N6)-threonylcarbamoyltransferase complex dimerization subunit type 1 TsaB [Steroidobacteraceae bacterium]
MKLLALDTATEACSAAVLAGDALVSRYIETERGHSEQILILIDAVLAEAGLRLRELDAVAFGRGPGAFTGVRLAASIAQGLAFGADLPVIPVSDLRALAQRLIDAEGALQGTLVCNDARMHEVYWACFRRGAEGIAEPYADERVGSPDGVQLPEEVATPLAGAGRGFRAYPELQHRLGHSLVRVEADWLPRATEVARLAAVEHAAGRSVAAEEALPVYLRNEVARTPSRD